MEKYKPFIEEWESFKHQSEKHPLQSLRRNPLKAQEDFEEQLGEEFKFKKASWNKKIYRVDDPTPGKTLLHWRGEYYVQEESAALPVNILNPQPEDKILDMCAAPGGKTTQIAAKMENKGLIVANDSSSQRLKSLHANIYRTGSKIVEVTNHDGRNIPEEEKFDRILVDAPCSGEGDRYYRNFEAANEKESRDLAKLQKNLLMKAEDLVKEGGTVVYSTCTITPLENEAVISEILELTDLESDTISTDVEHLKGVKYFQDEKYRDKVNKTVRVYPNHLKSGVIYIARLTK